VLLLLVVVVVVVWVVAIVCCSEEDWALLLLLVSAAAACTPPIAAAAALPSSQRRTISPAALAAKGQQQTMLSPSRSAATAYITCISLPTCHCLPARGGQLRQLRLCCCTSGLKEQVQLMHSVAPGAVVVAGGRARSHGASAAPAPPHNQQLGRG